MQGGDIGNVLPAYHSGRRGARRQSTPHPERMTAPVFSIATSFSVFVILSYRLALYLSRCRSLAGVNASTHNATKPSNKSRPA